MTFGTETVDPTKIQQTITEVYDLPPADAPREAV